jgi:D-alanine transaminase
MSRIAYVNGRYAPHGEAAVHIEDRGFQFADGVYEVWAVFGGALADAEGTSSGWSAAWASCSIAPPMSRAALQVVLRETVRRNRVREGLVYLQVTRGVAKRDHAFPDPAGPASVVVTAKRRPRDRGAAERARR